MVGCLLLVAASFIGVTSVCCQTTYLGVRGGYQHVMNTASIPIVPGSLDCGNFGDGASPGWFAGITVDYAILDSYLELSGGISYSLRPAALISRSNDNFEVLDQGTNSFQPLQRLHDFSANLGYVVAEFGIRSQPVDWLPLYVRIGLDAGNALLDAGYVQTERIVSPEGVLFPGGLLRRTTGSGDIGGIGTAYGAQAHIGANLPWFSGVTIHPEVGFRYGLNSISSQMSWTQSMLMAGVQVRFDLSSSPPPPPPPPPPPSLPPVVAEVMPLPVPEPVAEPVRIVSLTTDPLEIRETVTTQTFPILPYVFFDSASAQIKARYLPDRSSSAFNESELPRSTLPIYYRMLDLIGQRMRGNSAASLVITGTTDGREAGSQDARKQLAIRRAQAIADVIGERWGVDPSRFTIRTSDLPSIVSNDKYHEGSEENRRAELFSSSPSLLAPVVHTRFNEYVAEQSIQRFRVDVANSEQVRNWDLSVFRNGALVDVQRTSGTPPETVQFDLSQNLADRLGPVVAPVDSLVARLNIQQLDGSLATATTVFPLIKTVNAFEVARLSLIVFDFDQSEISAINRDMMKQLIGLSARPDSRASIIGSTDRLGEADHNKTLSSARAVAVESYLRTVAPFVGVDSVLGIGASQLPYDNSHPEGRFYCRTVSLTITTPLR